MISDLVPKIAEFADDMCFIHSMTAKSNTHGPAENQMSTGFILDGFPGIGSWVTYALQNGDAALLRVNAIGCGFAALYIAIFLAYSRGGTLCRLLGLRTAHRAHRSRVLRQRLHRLGLRF